MNADRRVQGHEWRSPATLVDHHPHASNGWLEQALRRLKPSPSLDPPTSHSGHPVFLPIGPAQAVQLTDHYPPSNPHLPRWVAQIAPLAHGAASAVTETLHALKARGIGLAFDHSVLTPAYAAWMPLADYIRLDVRQWPAGDFERWACFAQTYSRAQLIATRVANPEDVVRMTGYGIALLQGDWLSPPRLLQD